MTLHDFVGHLREWSRCKVEIWSAIAMVSWASYLMFHDNPLAAIPSYRVTISLLDENDWENAALLIGGLQLLSVMLQMKWWRVVGCGFAAWFWITLSFSFFLSGTPVPALMPLLSWGGINVHKMFIVVSGRTGKTLCMDNET